MTSAVQPGESCFASIGVYGDRSCPELAVHVHCLRCPVFAETARELFERPAPPGYRSEWTERLSTPEPPAIGPATTYLTVRVGREWLGIASASCGEVTEARRAFSLAHRTGGAFEGLVNVRGQVVLSVSLRALLDIPAEDGAGARARLVVVEDAEGRFSLRVDEVDGIRRFADSEVLPPPATLSRALLPHVSGMVHDGERVVGLMDGATLFAALARCVA